MFARNGCTVRGTQHQGHRYNKGPFYEVAGRPRNLHLYANQKSVFDCICSRIDDLHVEAR